MKTEERALESGTQGWAVLHPIKNVDQFDQQGGLAVRKLGLGERPSGFTQLQNQSNVRKQVVNLWRPQT
jgi:hypothetical protein